jgi:N-formylglutamate amidohydrolase
LRFADAERRIECLYHPYHHMLGRLVRETAGMFGGCLLVDCHSMPSSSGCGQEGADIVLGDCYGAACAPRILNAARRLLTDRGFRVAINAPYAGGFTTGFYGRPGAHCHALQIEINRALYMDERSYRRKPSFAQLVEDLAVLIERLGQAAQDCLPKTA